MTPEEKRRKAEEQQKQTERRHAWIGVAFVFGLGCIVGAVVTTLVRM